jgi:Kef-type K+ transport system membrane component KefB
MSIGGLALVVAVALLGPLVAWPTRLRIPQVVGELAAGVIIGRTGAQWIDPTDRTFTFLANIGFALIMFVAGAKVPIRQPSLRSGLRGGVARAIGVAVVAAALGYAVASAFGVGHTALYAVLMASSSAALILPIIDNLGLSGPAVLQLLPQVAIADAATIVALPLVIDPAHAGRAALGALAIIACALVLYVVLSRAEASGVRRRLHQVSERREFALELRISLLILLALAALAQQTHVSIMLAGFSFGLVVAAIGEPKRLARQLFGLTEGFLGPLFFVWLGASLDLRDLGSHPKFIGLGVALGVGAIVAHAAMRATGQPLGLAVLASAQLGVPVAAATLGTQLHVLRAGESSALILGALITIVAATLAARGAPRSPAPAAPPTASPPAPPPPG